MVDTGLVDEVVGVEEVTEAAMEEAEAERKCFSFHGCESRPMVTKTVVTKRTPCQLYTANDQVPACVSSVHSFLC